ncbi:MAG: IS66 family transposase [Planctomycetota bacterium]
MSQALDLPRDIESLTVLVLTLRETLTEQHEKIVRLEHDNHLLHKIAFGRSTEQRPIEVSGEGSPQGWLFAQEVIAEAARQAETHGTDATVEVVQHRRTKRKGGRRRDFPEHLPRVRTVIELAEDERTCSCGGELKEFSEEVTRELERLETALVHETVRKKYCCPKCQEKVTTAPWRGKVIEKGLLGPGFLSHVITERFGNHMPYYRLEKKYASEGLDLSRSVLCESMARCGELLEPIAEELKREVLASSVIHTDDTPVVVARPSEEAEPRKGRIWIYLNRAGRHWYDYTETRERDGPQQVLGQYEGYIQADAYGGYDQLYLPGKATEVACWAHVRRKFVDAEATDPELSKEAVDRIARLFLIESEAKRQGLGVAARLALRKEKSAPLVEEFRAWMERASLDVLPKGPLAKAIGYARNQWDALTRYLEDGRLSISNNAAERALRPFAVGRKNWLFFQRSTGGKTASILMSLLMTAKAAGVEPRTYFRDVLLRISTCSDVRTLTPHGWKERWQRVVAADRQRILQTLLG